MSKLIRILDSGKKLYKSLIYITSVSHSVQYNNNSSHESAFTLFLFIRDEIDLELCNMHRLYFKELQIRKEKLNTFIIITPKSPLIDN